MSLQREQLDKYSRWQCQNFVKVGWVPPWRQFRPRSSRPFFKNQMNRWERRKARNDIRKEVDMDKTLKREYMGYD